MYSNMFTLFLTNFTIKWTLHVLLIKDIVNRNTIISH